MMRKLDELMFDAKQVGYCTNVHSGSNLQEVQANLEKYSLEIKQQVSPNDPMPIGLWLCDEACTQALATNDAASFKDWLNERELIPYTFNAFPFHDFHQPVVKHNVYLPTWAERSRLDYTLAIARLQSELLGPDTFGTVSTLPLGWPTNHGPDFFNSCAEHLIECANELSKIRQATGCHLFVCIEPEPGCHFDSSKKLADFFEQYLLKGDQLSNDTVRQHLGVCHDVCHSAVMFEPQSLAIKTYHDAGIHVGKVQVSAAIEADFDEGESSDHEQLLNALEQFAEERYLHQTCIRSTPAAAPKLREDLAPALESLRESPTGKTRVHFHVPVYLDQIGPLKTTNVEITECLQSLSENELPTHIEVETYAWNVLPDAYRAESLAAGITDELKFVRQICGE